MPETELRQSQAGFFWSSSPLASLLIREIHQQIQLTSHNFTVGTLCKSCQAFLSSFFIQFFIPETRSFAGDSRGKRAPSPKHFDQNRSSRHSIWIPGLLGLMLNSEIASCKPPLLPEFWQSSGVQSRERSERTQPLPAVAALFHSSDVRTFLSLPESA